jgi:hypothetical protein
MSATEPTFGTWREALTQAEESEPVEPLSMEELSLELKGLSTLALVGLGLLIACGGFFVLSLNYVINGERTEGVVVNLRTGASRHGTTYAPVVYYVVGGEQYRVPNTSASTVRIYRKGQEVPVLYMPDDPGDSKIANFSELYLLPTILGTLGVVCFGAACGLGAYVVRKAGWRLLPRLT